jgi:hypothetical protein
VLLAAFSKSLTFDDRDGLDARTLNRFRHFDPNGTEFLVKPGRVNHSLIGMR